MIIKKHLVTILIMVSFLQGCVATGGPYYQPGPAYVSSGYYYSNYYPPRVYYVRYHPAYWYQPSYYPYYYPAYSPYYYGYHRHYYSYYRGWRYNN